MKIDDLIAIDVHTHAEVSCRQGPDPFWQPFEEAANKYFKAPPLAGLTRERRFLFP